MRKFLTFSLVVMMIFVFASCAVARDEPQPTPSDLPEIEDILEYQPFDTSKKVTLNLAVMYDNYSFITFNANASAPDGNPGYKAANGKTYSSGMIKPVWEELGKKLNFNIIDKSYEKSPNNLDIQWTTLQADSFKNIDMVNGRGEYIIEEGVQNNRFVDISQYFKNMPNLHKFLKDNPLIYKQILSGDGKMYYSPYFDGYDDLERMFLMRADWVEKLLDGDSEPQYDTLTTVDSYYEKFMPASMTRDFTIVKASGNATETITKSYASNIIDIQDALVVKNGANLTRALRNYIDTTYGGKYGTKRSEVFCGVNAVYDADELVALLRCVKTNPHLLTVFYDAIGNEYRQDEVIPFYPRTNQADRQMDVFRLAQIWGVRGMEGRSDWYYVDNEGVLQDSRLMENTYTGLEKLNQLYKEGLILGDYAEAGAGGNDATAIKYNAFTGDSSHRGRLSRSNAGFMTYDYNQTTTALNKMGDNTGSRENWGDGGWYVEGFNLTPVLPPFTNWDSGNLNAATEVEYTRYTESWRNVKADGWGILASSSQAKIERALTLMDYLYSAEGNKLMAYGPDAWLDGETDYQGESVPKLSDATMAELAHYAVGNYTNYYRRFLGGTFPIGYVKAQGMEYQTLHINGKRGLDNIMRAIELGTMSHIEVVDPLSVEPVMRSVPASWAYTQSISTAIKNNTASLNENFPTLGDSWVIFTKYVYYGFNNNSGIESTATKTKQGLRSELISAGFKADLQLGYARTAYGLLMG